ncbi:MAG: CxxxxCH/CxxCH domain-containing protein, partial [Bacteroidota bacterium]|nr:CxxxxCH/CxxCH domain-containing protein [Bacteroidota bacterium]
MKKITLFSIFAIILSGLFGCSERKDEKLPTQAAVSVHGKGFADTNSANFHGVYLKSINNDVTKCQSCHGKTFTGGTVNASCVDCHKAVHDKDFGNLASPNFHAKYLQANQYDVASCQSCHGVNFDGKGTASKSCYQCHTVMHDKSFGVISSPNFHAKYLKTNNYNLQSCQSCHGTAYDGGGVAVKSCNTCHNKPSGPENCTTCHGSTNAAPPKDLADNVLPTFRGVGAHQKHLLGGVLNLGIACNECHKVPTVFSSQGHIDATSYAEVKFDSASVFFTANASYNATNISCTNTYCHGNFNGGNNLSVTWNDTSSTVAACGTC